MKKQRFAPAALVASLCCTAGTASAQDVLTGDMRLACEAILCLAARARPSECTPSLSRYFGISKRKLTDTLKGRLSFLNLCPVANQTPQMSSLVSAISAGAGRCDAQSLNSSLVMWTGSDDGGTYISNQLPDYCIAYGGHAYTDLSGTLPRYVGTPEKGGYWVEARDYERALAEYNARLQAEQQQQSGAYWWR
jgi:hypothetical protein